MYISNQEKKERIIPILKASRKKLKLHWEATA